MINDWIANIGTKDGDDVLWRTWLAGIKDNAEPGGPDDHEALALEEAIQAQIDGEIPPGIELEVRSMAIANTVANFKTNQAGTFLFAMAVNGSKPGAGIPRVKKLNGIAPGLLISQAARELKQHSEVKGQDDTAVMFMITDETDGA